MAEIEDWLQDPLMIIDKGSYQYRKPKSLKEEDNKLWQGFHFSTRLKLDGADYFCRQVLGAASRPTELGLPLLAYRQLKWYLDAFFFELISAYDTLLQELGVVYAYDLGLEPEGVRWNKIKGKLPIELVKYMEEEQKKEWFKKVRQYRNTAAHHSYLWISEVQGRQVGEPWNYDTHKISIYRLDDNGKVQFEEISVCSKLLAAVVGHIHQVWNEMAQEFK